MVFIFNKILKKIEKLKSKTFLGFVLVFLLSMIIVDLAHLYTGHYLTEPFLKFLSPVELEVEAIPFPLAREGKLWTRVVFHNKGLSDIENIRVEFRDYCFQNKTQVAPLGFSKLEKNGKEIFEYETPRNTNCSPIAEIPKMSFFKDQKGTLYCDYKEKTIDVCLYCPLNIRISSNFEVIKDVNFSMPFFEGGLWASISSDSCLPIEKAEDPSKLELVYETPRAILSDISTMCLTGEISVEWCNEHGYNPINIK